MKTTFAAATLFIAFLATTASAQQVTKQATDGGARYEAIFLKELLVTSDALDSPTGVSDVVLHLRGALSAERDLEIGTFGVNAAVEAFQFRDIDFENDRSASLGATFRRQFNDRFALRGSLAAIAEEQGEDLDLGIAIIGTRTRSLTLNGEIEAITRLSENLVATTTFSSRHENSGRSTFTIPLPDIRLSTDRNIARGEIALARILAGRRLSVIGRTTLVSLHGPVAPGSAIPSQAVSLSVRLDTVSSAGVAIGLESGLAMLRDSFDITDRLYPVYAVSLAKAWPDGRSLDFTLKGFIDVDDSDDPLASHVHRAEVEFSEPLPGNFNASIGVFGELRDNLAIENREEAAGVYLALGYDPSKHLSYLLRADLAERHRSLIETRQKTLSARFGVQLAF